MAILSDQSAVVDTNIFVYSLYDQHEHYTASSVLLLQAQEGHIHLCVTPQIIAEVFAVITNPRRVSEVFQPEEALEAITSATTGLTILPVPIDVTDRWMELVRRIPVAGGDVFDVQIVATMLGNGVEHIYTFNRKDFERFSEVTVLTP